MSKVDKERLVKKFKEAYSLKYRRNYCPIRVVIDPDGFFIRYPESPVLLYVDTPTFQKNYLKYLEHKVENYPEYRPPRLK